jgi:hypothetical protein
VRHEVARETLIKFGRPVPAEAIPPPMHGIMAARHSGGKCVIQMGFPAMDFASKKKQTRRRDRCLEPIEATTPWALLLGLIESHCPKGERAIAIERMLRMHIAQHGFGLADEATEGCAARQPVEQELRGCGAEPGGLSECNHAPIAVHTGITTGPDPGFPRKAPCSAFPTGP